MVHRGANTPMDPFRTTRRSDLLGLRSDELSLSSRSTIKRESWVSPGFLLHQRRGRRLSWPTLTNRDRPLNVESRQRPALSPIDGGCTPAMEVERLSSARPARLGQYLSFTKFSRD